MKISSKQYAAALLSSILENPGKERLLLSNFVSLLRKRGDFSKWPEVLEFFIGLWDRHFGLVEAEVISARDLDGEVREMILAFMAKESPGLRIDLKETVDEKLIGGAILRLPDRVLDFSVSSQIKELAKALKS